VSSRKLLSEIYEFSGYTVLPASQQTNSATRCVDGHLVANEVTAQEWLTHELLLVVPPDHRFARKKTVNNQEVILMIVLRAVPGGRKLMVVVIGRFHRPDPSTCALGVIDTEVGCTGGWLVNPTYADTHHSKSGHAEAIRVTFDPAVLYEELLRTFGRWGTMCHF
jgi:hypothetical protein